MKKKVSLFLLMVFAIPHFAMGGSIDLGVREWHRYEAITKYRRTTVPFKPLQKTMFWTQDRGWSPPPVPFRRPHTPYVIPYTKPNTLNKPNPHFIPHIYIGPNDRGGYGSSLGLKFGIYKSRGFSLDFNSFKE